MAKRETPAERSKRGASQSAKKTTSAAKKRAQQENLAKGREARRKQVEARREADERGEPRETASDRWAKLLDGTMTVQDLDDEEIRRMTVRSADGSFAGRKRAIPSHLVQQFHREAIKRANDRIRTAAPAAVKALLEIGTDPDVPEATRIRALTYLVDRGLGKMPETVVVAEADKWAETRDGAFGGVDRNEFAD